MLDIADTSRRPSRTAWFSVVGTPSVNSRRRVGRPLEPVVDRIHVEGRDPAHAQAPHAGSTDAPTAAARAAGSVRSSSGMSHSEAPNATATWHAAGPRRTPVGPDPHAVRQREPADRDDREVLDAPAIPGRLGAALGRHRRHGAQQARSRGRARPARRGARRSPPGRGRRRRPRQPRWASPRRGPRGARPPAAPRRRRPASRRGRRRGRARPGRPRGRRRRGPRPAGRRPAAAPRAGRA